MTVRAGGIQGIMGNWIKFVDAIVWTSFCQSQGAIK